MTPRPLSQLRGHCFIPSRILLLFLMLHVYIYIFICIVVVHIQYAYTTRGACTRTEYVLHTVSTVYGDA